MFYVTLLDILIVTVRAMEDVKCHGSKVNANEMLQNVAVRVQSRQSQEQLQVTQTKKTFTMVSGGDVLEIGWSVRLRGSIN